MNILKLKPFKLNFEF